MLLSDRKEEKSQQRKGKGKGKGKERILGSDSLGSWALVSRPSLISRNWGSSIAAAITISFLIPSGVNIIRPYRLFSANTPPRQLGLLACLIASQMIGMSCSINNTFIVLIS